MMLRMKYQEVIVGIWEGEVYFKAVGPFIPYSPPPPFHITGVITLNMSY